MKNNTVYLVGYEKDNEFWCSFETPYLENAKTYLNSIVQSSEHHIWNIYEKIVSYKVIESVTSLDSKENRLSNAMIASI